MLVIRAEQVAAFADAAREERVQRIATRARQDIPEHLAGFDDDALRQRVRDGIARAAQHDVTSERAVTAFVLLGFETVLAFDEHPAVRAILDNSIRGDVERMQRVFALDAQVWNEIALASGETLP